jgi:hypothetical protein
VPPDPIPSDAWLEVHFVDVGQGDAIWIHTHDDNVEVLQQNLRGSTIITLSSVASLPPGGNGSESVAELAGSKEPTTIGNNAAQPPVFTGE